MCIVDAKPVGKALVRWDELALHDKPDDLWVAIEGKAYDVTAWRLEHPGGWRLLEVRARGQYRRA